VFLLNQYTEIQLKYHVLFTFYSPKKLSVATTIFKIKMVRLKSTNLFCQACITVLIRSVARFDSCTCKEYCFRLLVCPNKTVLNILIHNYILLLQKIFSSIQV
jgi:hypothetical protein